LIPHQLDFKLCHVLTAFLDIKSTEALHTVGEKAWWRALEPVSSFSKA
jgi:hypothetical protein